MKKNPYIRNINKHCSICGRNVVVDQYLNGNCGYCGWEQGGDALDYPDIVRYPNRIPFNQAKKLFGEGKPLIPSFEDFIGMFKFYSEVEFTYKGRLFGLYAPHNHILEFFEQGNDDIQYYNTIEEFKANAYIDRILLKDIWHYVKDVDYM